MNKKGFLLAEVLVAASLLSIAGAGLYAGFSQAAKIKTAVYGADALYSPVKFLWMRAAKDLRNSVTLREHRFIAKQEEMLFPVLTAQGGLRLIRYFYKKGSFVRSELALPEKFVAEDAREMVLIEGVQNLRFEYAYLDEEDKLLFRPLWMEEPYLGIPKAVRIELKMKKNGRVFSRIIPIPQGVWGQFVSEADQKP